MIQQDAFLAKLLLEHLILRPEIFDDVLLLAIHPAGQDHQKELPKVQNVYHVRPDDGAKAPTMRLDLPFVNAAVGREVNLSPLVSPAIDRSYSQAESFDRTSLCFTNSQPRINHPRQKR